MATVTLKGSEMNTNGNLPEINHQAPDFSLIAKDLSVKTLKDYSGKRVVLNIFPSIDTGTCAASVRKFNEKAASLDNTIILCISRDLPFAHSRFCAAEGIENVETLSEMRDFSFSDAYGLRFIDGALQSLHSRCVVVIDENGKVIHTEQVQDIVNEPNYDDVLKILS